jgi:nitric oxide reductase subunit C
MHSPTAARAWLLVAFAAVAAGTNIGAVATRTAPQDDGRALAEELGCGGCHAGMPAADRARERAPALGPQAVPLPADFVFDYLADPVRRRDDIGRTRMPDFDLDEGERVALAALLGSGAPGPELDAARARHPGADAESGRRVFGALGCGACHSGIAGAISNPGPDLSREGVRVRRDWLTAFLASPRRIRSAGHPGAPGARMPDFRLTSDEASALATLISGSGRRFETLDSTPLTRFQVRRTERILEDRLACLGCHRIAGRGGRIGPSLEGLSERLQPGFVLEAILDPGRAMPGSPMPHQPLDERDARRLARYLLGAAGDREPVPSTSLADPTHPAWAMQFGGDPEKGSVLYARHCSACHGPQGRGDGWNAPELPVTPAAHADPAIMSRRPDDALFDAIYGGAWVLDGSPRMPPFGALLSAAEIRSLVATIRNLCGCSGPPWSADGRPASR